MVKTAETGKARPSNSWRIVMWGGAAAVLLMPLIAMQFISGITWSVFDFAVFGGMLFMACGAYELAAGVSRNLAYRAAVGVALFAAFILVWMNLAVGIIGSEENPANLMYGGVLAVGLIGALIARFQPRGMARALVATAIAQGLVAVIAIVAGLGYTFVLTGIFVVLWLTSARLFHKAAQA